MANPGRAVPIKPVSDYGVLVTEPQPELTLADVLEVMKTGFAQLSTAIATTNANVKATNDAVADLSSKVDALDAKIEILDAKADAMQTEMREGFAGLKGETALLERYILGVQRAVTDHLNNPDNHHRHAA